MMPDAIRERVEKSRPQFTPFADFFGGAENRIMTGVRCELCNSPIMGMIEFALGKHTLGQLPLYCEIEITFDDGSKHVTSLCKACVDQGINDKLEEIYCGDLIQWEDDEKNGDSPVHWEQWGYRKPLSFKRR